MTQSPPNLICVLSTTNSCLGFLRSAGPKGVQAYDGDGQLLGLFEDKSQAVEAIVTIGDSNLIVMDRRAQISLCVERPKRGRFGTSP